MRRQRFLLAGCLGLLIIGAIVFRAAAADGQISGSLLQKARSGDAAAQLELGFTFFQQSNPELASFWFGMAAQQGNAEAQYNLGRCYLDGYGIERNGHLAMQWLEKAAAQQLVPARLKLAEVLKKGVPEDPDAIPPQAAIAPDRKRAETIYRELADAGNPEAQRELGILLLQSTENAEEQSKRHAEARTYLERAAPKDAPARVILARTLLVESDSRSDVARAIEILTKAAEADETEAQALLGFAYETGLGLPPDQRKAYELYERALAKKFSPQVAFRLANYALAGRAGCQQNIPRALALYRRSAEEGIPEAALKLGICYRDGIGVKKSPDRAFELFFQAARADVPDAQFEVAKCFTDGIGTPADAGAAFYWFRQSAMRGDPRGMLECGKDYLKGIGTAPDAEQARLFLVQAANNGMNEAVEILSKLPEAPEAASTPEPQETPRFQLRLKR